MPQDNEAQRIPERLIYPIPEACAILGDLSNSFFYNLVSGGLIRLTKIGSRSFVSDDELRGFVLRMSSGERIPDRDALHPAKRSPDRDALCPAKRSPDTLPCPSGQMSTDLAKTPTKLKPP